MSFKSSDDGFISDSSGQLDLLSVKQNLQLAGDANQSDAHEASKSPSETQQERIADEPAWVLDHSQSRPTDRENRRRVLASLSEDDDDDSIIDLISQEQNLEATPKPIAEEKSNGEQKSTQKPSKNPKLPHTPKSSLPLTVSPKVDDSLVLLQSSDEDLDLSGDVGAVGRVKVSEEGLFFDIKGVVYRVTTHATNTACIVQMVEDEARVTSVMDEVLTLHIDRNVFASDEIIINGNLDDNSDEESLFGDAQSSEQPERRKGKKASTSAGSKAKSA
ncbi:DNA-binding protein BIN4 [Gracilaria domingensis]|nr:DNA-binding protein BIN4 [Gracilaria domingensis]